MGGGGCVCVWPCSSLCKCHPICLCNIVCRSNAFLTLCSYYLCCECLHCDTHTHAHTCTHTCTHTYTHTHAHTHAHTHTQTQVPHQLHGQLPALSLSTVHVSCSNHCSHFKCAGATPFLFESLLIQCAGATPFLFESLLTFLMCRCHPIPVRITALARVTRMAYSPRLWLMAIGW